MKYIFILLVSFVLFQLSALGQISEGGLPVSFYNLEVKKNYTTIATATVNHKQMLYQDSIEASNKTVPYKFGKALDVSLNTDNSGNWQTLSNEDKIWQLGIQSKGAYSLNFIFNKFRLPKGSKLFIYNPDRRDVLGAFTEKNNRDDGVFSTTIIKGDFVIIEYYEPKSTEDSKIKDSKIRFELVKVIHAYRDLWKKAEGYYGQSGPCNINVNCPDGLPWYNEKRAVALILVYGNSALCSGELVNNVRQDGTPYFLTANHCLESEPGVNTWLFMFNYESPGCTTQNGPINQTINGATLKATDTPSDFALLELGSKPPQSYNVYFAGWNALDSASDSCVVLHHPKGDIKKISFETPLIINTTWDSVTFNTHWEVPFYEKGTTEPGSSGSALFGKDHRIKGQLHGGNAACTDISDDYYGKFSYSWDSGSIPSTRLKDWLDPDSTGIISLNGKDFKLPILNIDAALTGILSPGPGPICNSTAIPEVIIKNNGAHPLKTADIYWKVDTGNWNKYSWQGKINYLNTQNIIFEPINFGKGNHKFTAFISNPNDSTDDNLTNDTAIVTFTAVNGNNITVTLKTDKHAELTSWIIRDSNEQTVYTNPPLFSTTLSNTELCLPAGCYDFILLDASGKGMCAYTPPDSAYAQVGKGNTLFGHINGCKFDTSYTIHFCVKAGIQSITSGVNSFRLFPNPSVGELFLDYISINHLPANGFIYSIEGKLLREFTIYDNKRLSLEIIGLQGGIYFIRIQNNDATYYRKFIKI